MILMKRPRNKSERDPRKRVSHEAFVNQSWRYCAAASTPPLGYI
jgi:hypothetical protein